MRGLCESGPRAAIAIGILLGCPGCFLFIPCRLSDAGFDETSPSYDDAAAELLREYETQLPDGFLLSDIVGGSCSDEGPRFLFRFTTAHSWQFDYFDAETNEHIGSSIDGGGFNGVLLGWTCPGGQFVSERVECPNPTVTELITPNNGFTIGDTVP